MQIATAIAVLFHLIGLIGFLFFDRHFFSACTPVNMLISFFLILWTQKAKNRFFLIFIATTFVVAFIVETIGVHTGALFGKYVYGTALGIAYNRVPLIIGINWIIIIYCSGISIQILLLKAINRVASDTNSPPLVLKALSVIADGATLAVTMDWLMEPVAVKLGFWKWVEADAGIPFYNYISWVVVSMLLLLVFHFCRFDKQNKFAVNLLLIQAMFFLILRTFIN